MTILSQKPEVFQKSKLFKHQNFGQTKKTVFLVENLKIFKIFFFYLNFGLDIINSIRRLDFEGNGLAGQCFDKDLHLLLFFNSLFFIFLLLRFALFEKL